MPEHIIYESNKSKIYYLENSDWGRPVVMKVLNYEFPKPADISKFYNEYEIIEGLQLRGSRGVLKRTKDKNRHLLFLEWFEGQSLRDAFRNKQKDIQDFLHIAIAIADALGEIHQQNIIHKDINPFNILVNLQRRTVKLIDFGISTKIDLKQHHLGNPEHLEGTLPYCSPEQTGRMNRVVDYRTDLYSLGVTFYEVLTGHLPFEADDAMELVHSHIAKMPAPIRQANSCVPPVLEAIVEKLLAKNAEDRYQSAYGLKADLERCLAEWEKSGTISSFPLGENDYSGRFCLPQQLFGREREVKSLIEAFERCSQGKLETVLVAGYSGTGKSALVHEVHRPITGSRGYFIEGKFDQYLRSVPYYALIQAFRELVDLLLTENEDKIALLRDKIQAAVGAEGKVLTDVIPNLEYIIGPQPEVPSIGGTEAQNRFNYLFRKFVHAVSTREHPLVLFIDDLQWADSASLNLLKILMTDPKGGFLLCIGAYRDNEVNPSHPFSIMGNELKESGARISRISIGNLEEEHVNQLIAEAIDTSPGEEPVRELTRLVYGKTRGNVFFVIQFLKSLYEEGLLVFDFTSFRWTWNLNKIREKNITDNVVELLGEKVRKLPEDTRQAMKLGACIGNTFDTETLAVLLGKPPEDLRKDLHEGLREGLLAPLGEDRIKFTHDRIQQAIYSLIPPGERNNLHVHIGQLLLEHLSQDQQEERLFDIVNQLNHGLTLIQESTVREQLARLNLRAGIKAKNNSAFQLSYNYLQSGIDLLREEPWKNQYDLCLPLFTEAAEAAYLCGDFAEMEKLYREILANARSILDKVKAYDIRLLAFKAENKLMDAVNTGLEVLEQLGERFPRKPNTAQVMADFAWTAFLLKGKTNEQLLALPEMTNPHKIAAMRIIANITSSVYWAAPNLLLLIVFRMVRMSLKYGNTPVSAYSFGSYGVLMCGVVGAMKKGHEFGKLALLLLDKFNAKEWRAQIYVTIYALIIHWVEHVRNSLRPLQDSFQIGFETGAIEYACVNTNIYCIHSFLCGKPLVRLEEEAKGYSQSFRQFKQETNVNYNEVYRQAMLNFMGQSADPVKLTGEAYDEDRMMAQNRERNDKTGTYFIHFNKLILAYYFRQHEEARRHGEEARKLLPAVLGKFEIPNHYFYEALNLLALCQGAKPAGKRSYLSRVRKSYGQLKKWARSAPENYRHKHQLVKAELLRIQGRHSDARVLYDKAIEGAQANEFLHEAALGYELAGRFYLEQKSDSLAGFYLKEAYNTYREWGAAAKLSQLEQQFPRYISGIGRGGGILFKSVEMGTLTSQIYGSALDIASVLKAATTISGEVVLSRLLDLLMNIVVENAGAQRGLLFLGQEELLYLEARQELGEKGTGVLQHIPIDQCDFLAVSVVKFVTRTWESVVIHDANKDPQYKNDPYIRNHRPNSILCLPIINQGKFVGVLYLENNLTTDAFTQERIHLLSMLSGQIAVSIDNAILYENLEQKVAERTAALAEEKRKSDELLYNILPEETAEELKRTGRARPRKFESVTVMFSDFVNFTTASTALSPEELVNTVDTCFSAFDLIISKHGIEKIKTIGDAYMCASGLPVQNSTHAENTIRAALEITRWIDEFNREREAKGLVRFDMRIGIHTGPVVAGVVGTRKFAYDVWGDTVNTASRLETTCDPGRINISGDTYELVKNRFACSYRGKVAVKNKGEIEMYFVENT